MLASLWSLAIWLRGGRFDWPPVAADADADADADALSWSLSDAMAAVVFALAGPLQARLLTARVGDGSSVTAAEELQKSRLGLDCCDALRCAEPGSTLNSTDGGLVSACGLLTPAPKGLLVEGETRVNGCKGWLMSAPSDAMRQAGFRTVQGGQLTAAPVKKSAPGVQHGRAAKGLGMRIGAAEEGWRMQDCRTIDGRGREEL